MVTALFKKYRFEDIVRLTQESTPPESQFSSGVNGWWGKAAAALNPKDNPPSADNGRNCSTKLDRISGLQFLAGVELLQRHKLNNGIMLVPSEVSAIRDGHFTSILVAASQEEQKRRLKINELIQKASSVCEKFGWPQFEAFHDPERLDNIRSIVLTDPTGKYLLEQTPVGETPVFLAHVTETASKNSPIYSFWSSDKYEDPVGEYIVLFVNSLNNQELASSYIHEGRHSLQTRLLHPLQKVSLLPLEKVVLEMLKEADAFAVETKADWHWTRTTKNFSGKLDLVHQFELAMTRAHNTNLKSFERNRDAAQHVFIYYLEQEFFNKANYLKTSITKRVQQQNDLSRGLNLLSTSHLFSSDFLKRLSKVGNNASYLNDDGIAKIRKIVLEGMPQALKRYGQPIAPSP